MKEPSRFELIVDRLLESDTAMIIGGAIIGALIAIGLVWAYLFIM